MKVWQHIYQEMTIGVEKELCDNLMTLIKTDEKYLIALCNCEVPRKAFLRLYRTLPKIEDMEAIEKKELKEYVLKTFTGASVERLVENCKLYYTVSQLI